MDNRIIGFQTNREFYELISALLSKYGKVSEEASKPIDLSTSSRRYILFSESLHSALSAVKILLRFGIQCTLPPTAKYLDLISLIAEVHPEIPATRTFGAVTFIPNPNSIVYSKTRKNSLYPALSPQFMNGLPCNQVTSVLKAIHEGDVQKALDFYKAVESGDLVLSKGRNLSKKTKAKLDWIWSFCKRYKETTQDALPEH